MLICTLILARFVFHGFRVVNLLLQPLHIVPYVRMHALTERLKFADETLADITSCESLSE